MKRHVPGARLASLLTLTVSCLATPALAQQPSATGEEPRGWRGGVTWGATLNLIQSGDVVGQADAFTVLVGTSLAGQATYVRGPHALSNSLQLELAWARTPAAAELVKSNDVLRAESLYAYRVLDWTGPYAQWGLLTHLLPAEDVRPVELPYRIERRDGTVERLVQSRLRLSPGLSPLTLEESAGWSVRPVGSPGLTWDVRLGAGARQTLLREGTLVMLEREDTPEVDALEVGPVFQAGLALATRMRGGLEEGRLGYELGASALLPLVSNGAAGLTPLERVRLVLDARANVGILSWLTLSYQLLVVHDREFVRAVQTQNNLLLRFQYSLGNQER
ncbi:MAG TPA: hypothetical protein VFZ09_24100 [Archangium sp.]|uniref:hypothetical protein n=1 Tax=Archangium sp. TaxID=1872627 RepID=UPI002E3436C7|nr:hypothetical protein [Archangium sp.]HEX5749334.1 hypothetical protein [Archangium sp.]